MAAPKKNKKKLSKKVASKRPRMATVKKPARPTKRKAAAPPVELPRRVRGTERWPKNSVKPGEFITVPRVLLKRLGKMQLEPRHLWLLLALQVDRYRDRVPRYYWAELADFCGKEHSTVRRWARELEELGLLKIERCFDLESGTPRVGHRNARNKFHLGLLEARVEHAQAEWEKERPKRRKRKKFATAKKSARR